MEENEKRVSDVSFKEQLRIINPFQYRSHIVRQELFIDRKTEISTAKVVCQQIGRGKPGGLLIIGGRASGKTSLLEALKRELTEISFPSVLIHLDESMTKPGSEVDFSKLILAELTRSCAENDRFDKTKAQVIRAFLQGIGEKVESISVEFPGISLVARWDKTKMSFPGIALRDGISDVLRNIKDPVAGKSPGIALMLDEGDTLTNNKIILQMLRNVFQELKGIALVISGTTQLLDQVSEVFSPVPRFFYKIEMGPFPEARDVQDAIEQPLDLMFKEDLPTLNFKFDILHRKFDPIMKEISSSRPFDINMLCYFAFEQACLKAELRDGKTILYMNLDKEVMDIAIQQLRGTKNYADFLSDLTKEESRYLSSISKFSGGLSIEELELAVNINDIGDNVQLAPISELLASIPNFGDRKEIESKINQIASKGSKHSLIIIKRDTGQVGQILYELEDQWVRAYFKYGDEHFRRTLKHLWEIRGVRAFGDPVSSILHSIFLPRFGDHILGDFTWKAHTKESTGEHLKPDKGGQVLNINYVRTSTGTLAHLAFQIEDNLRLKDVSSDIESVMVFLKNKGLLTFSRVQQL